MNCTHCQDKGTVNKYDPTAKEYRDYPCDFCRRIRIRIAPDAVHDRRQYR